jgi:hypothetical protein
MPISILLCNYWALDIADQDYLTNTARCTLRDDILDNMSTLCSMRSWTIMFPTDLRAGIMFCKILAQYLSEQL